MNLIQQLKHILSVASAILRNNPSKEKMVKLHEILKDTGKIIEQIFPEPAYDTDPKELPMNKPVLTAGVGLRGHSPAWCGGTLAEKKAMYQLALKVCVEEKLSPAMTKDLLLTIYGESGFNSWCVNQKSLDYGLCQFSAKYYLKEYKMSPQEAVDNPRRCLQIMARNFKAGRQSNWVAFAHRKKYLKAIEKLA